MTCRAVLMTQAYSGTCDCAADNHEPVPCSPVMSAPDLLGDLTTVTSLCHEQQATLGLEQRMRPTPAGADGAVQVRLDSWHQQLAAASGCLACVCRDYTPSPLQYATEDKLMDRSHLRPGHCGCVQARCVQCTTHSAAAGIPQNARGSRPCFTCRTKR